jgi:YlmC/YmxH family sporulation protein
MVVLMLMSDLQHKDIINTADGAKIGKIIDIEVNNEGLINYLIVGKIKIMKRFNQQGEVKITFKQIKRIGTDVILVELN